MNTHVFRSALVFLSSAGASATLLAQSTPPANNAEIEAAYTMAIEKRTDAILQDLALNDSAKQARLHDVITNQYRNLRARDAAIEAKLKAAGKDASAKVERAGLMQEMSKPLHDQFISKLSSDLTPEQLEKVKDKMTYNKVKVTYDAYCDIVPNLSDSDKAKIMELLKAARDEAIDGGSADEKSAIFQKYKDQINDYLNAHGHDVAKAYADWNAKQAKPGAGQSDAAR